MVLRKSSIDNIVGCIPKGKQTKRIKQNAIKNKLIH